MIKFRFIFLLFFAILQSCSRKEAPTIYFSNASKSPIRQVEASWNKKFHLTLSFLNPGDSRSQSFYIRRNSSFFGPIYISWYNDRGDKIVKNFEFKESNLPSISEDHLYSYVQFYIGQEDLEIVTSDTPDVAGKTSRMDRLLKFYNDSYSSSVSQSVINQSCSNPMTECVDNRPANNGNSLITVKDE
jgi:hypothetical protein